MKDTRTELTGHITLCTSQENGSREKLFRIISKINSGASSMVYEAYCGEQRGILKEFYPRASASCFERDPDGQLRIISGQTKLAAEAKLYLEPYELLTKYKMDSDELNTFIPLSDIFYGKTDSRTLYIWSPESRVKPFDAICREYRENMGNNPHEKLEFLLKVIRQLCSCVSLMHKGGLLHRDIKPENFGIKQLGGELLDQHVTMFDVDTVCSASSDVGDVCSSEGYDAPELRIKRPNTVFTDIYAIGAVLFHAVIVTDETLEKHQRYSDEFYPHLKNLTDNSAYITACEDNSHPRFRRRITRILQKSLAAEPANRYPSCEKMKRDIDSALKFLSFDEEMENLYAGEKVKRKKNSDLSFIYHLYEHPLYSGSDNISAAIIGFGAYGQKFLDKILQMGQMCDRTLTVNVFAREESDKEIYLSDRPALTEFFSVDGADVEDSYGSIFFSTVSLDWNDPQRALRRVSSRLSECTYFFISLADTDFNRRVADAVEALVPSAHICYATVDESDDSRAINVCRDLENSAIHKDIERMAFNAHLLWNRSLNVERQTVYEDFMKPYHHDSCVAAVTAMKYRLYSIDIDMDKLSAEEAAEEFQEYVDDLDKKNLVMYEHRRWNTEKLCKGWVCEKDIRYAMRNGCPKDEKNRRHICLLKSKNISIYHSIWEEPDLTKLDDLDRLSVIAHNELLEYADEIKSQSGELNKLLMDIREEIRTDKSAINAFSEWYCCIKEIWEGSKTASKLYDSLKNAFYSALPENAESVRMAADEFTERFKPVYQSQMRKNYKKEDRLIIDNIPFILTYSHNEHLVIPLCTGDISAHFENVSAAAIIAPERITYICRAENAADAEDIFDAVSYILSFTDRKNMQARLFLHVQTDAENIPEISEKLSFGGAVNVTVSDKPYSFEGEFSLMKNSSSYFADTEDIFGKYPSFRFDRDKQRIENISGCGRFSFIGKKPHLTAEDTGLPVSRSEQPEFFEDNELIYEIYSSCPDGWRRLCRELRSLMSKNDVIGTLHISGSPRSAPMSFVLPAHCREAVKQLISVLSEGGFIGENSRDRSLSIDSFRADIDDIYGNKAVLGRLFSMVYHIPFTYVNISGNSADIMLENLICEGLQTDVQTEKLLFRLHEKGYISEPKKSENGFSFTFGSGKIRTLLTDENAAEIACVYHTARKSGCDDAAVLTDGSRCIITSGYKATLVYSGESCGYTGLASEILTAAEYLNRTE